MTSSLLQGEPLRHALAKAGWAAASDSVWAHLAAQRPQVVFLAPPFDSVPSAQGNAIYVLVQQLIESLPMPVVGLAMPPADQSAWDSPIADRLLYYQGSRAPGLLERVLPYRVRKQIWGTSRPAMLRYPRAAAAAAALLGADVLVIEDHPPYCVAAYQQAPSLKIVLHQHIDAPLGMPKAHWQQVIRSLSSIIFVARKTMEETEALHGELGVPAHVVYNGVDLAHYDPMANAAQAAALREQYGIPAAAPLLLFVGRMVRGKGVLEALQAFEKASLSDAYLLVVGDTESILTFDAAQADYLQALAVYREKDRIIWAGGIAQKALPTYYAAADAVIVPTIQSEGLPKVVTEALAMGKPLIASDRGGIFELVREGENGWRLHDPRQPDAIAQVIQMALSDRDRLSAMSQRIIEIDRPRMDDHFMIEQFEACLQTVLHGSAR